MCRGPNKSSVDLEARMIRLKSNSYTTITILDTVTAATVQFKEMGGSSMSRSKANGDAATPLEQQDSPDYSSFLYLHLK
ncbi:hypothetical protein BRADI_2g58803v3 [Brachypodium distachyon]|uniref:Uncharacterized protein n=1 Tax=Brachypodium distachyon TaxID=15368 RepID=A0A0Q3IZT2_BRADI|nr:hypothetical protein BRADI_2g58803v3 [Brachypodium distachyon]